MLEVLENQPNTPFKIKSKTKVGGEKKHQAFMVKVAKSYIRWSAEKGSGVILIKSNRMSVCLSLCTEGSR